LLLKEQETNVWHRTEIKQKEVKIAELKPRRRKRAVKQAEAQAQVRVLQAKAERLYAVYAP